MNIIGDGRGAFFNPTKTGIKFDLELLGEAQRIHVGKTMESKKGGGAIFINCMEKLSMNGPRETLKVRLDKALDAGIDGITLSAGLHLGSVELIKEHPRFNDVMLGIIVSSVRALRPFLKRASRVDRKPDYIIVEGPKAGGHLGFGMDWKDYDLRSIYMEVLQFIKHNDLDRRWEETDWFMKLIDEVSSSGIIDALNDDKEAKRNFQTKLVNIWFNPDKLADEKTIGLQGSWKTVARAVDAATKKLVDEFRAKYVDVDVLEELD